MKRSFQDVRFYETYYFCNIVRNILHNPSPYLRGIDDMFGDNKYIAYLKPYQRFTPFHAIIEHLVESVLFEELAGIDFDKRRSERGKFGNFPHYANQYLELPINHALKHHSIEHISFCNWLVQNGDSFESADEDLAHEYYCSLRDGGEFDELLNRMVNEVFFITFGSRSILKDFNSLFASFVQDARLDELDPSAIALFKKNGVLNRCAPPQWAKDAVFYRDRGLCSQCASDLSGIINLGSQENFDHIIPLARGGLNDVTNLQLLCAACNGSKSAREVEVSPRYQAWYPMESDQ